MVWAQCNQTRGNDRATCFVLVAKVADDYLRNIDELDCDRRGTKGLWVVLFVNLGKLCFLLFGKRSGRRFFSLPHSIQSGFRYYDTTSSTQETLQLELGYKELIRVWNATKVPVTAGGQQHVYYKVRADRIEWPGVLLEVTGSKPHLRRLQDDRQCSFQVKRKTSSDSEWLGCGVIFRFRDLK